MAFVAWFPDGNQENPLGSEQRAEPTSRMARATGQKEDAGGPLCHLVIGIVNTVGVEQSVAFGDLIALPASAQKVKSMPQADFVKKQFEQFCGSRPLSKAVAIRDDDHPARDSKHFRDYRRGIRNVV